MAPCTAAGNTRGATSVYTGPSVGWRATHRPAESRVQSSAATPRPLLYIPPQAQPGTRAWIFEVGVRELGYLAAWPGPWRMRAYCRSQGARRMRPSRSMRPRSALQASANDSRNREDYARPVRLAVGGSSGAAVCPAGSFPGQTGAPVSRADHATFTVGHCPQGAPRRHCVVKSGHCHQTLERSQQSEWPPSPSGRGL